MLTLLFVQQLTYPHAPDSLPHNNLPSSNIHSCRWSLLSSLKDSPLRQNVFSINIIEINPASETKETLVDYIKAVLGLTLCTWWLMIALRKDSSFHRSNTSILRRILWPLFYAFAQIQGWVKSLAGDRRSPRDSRLSGGE